MIVAALIISPLVGEAQTANFPSQPAQPLSGINGQTLPITDVVNLINQITTKVVQGGQALQNLAGSATGQTQTVTTQNAAPGGSNYDVSGLVNLWNNINNWFSQNVGTSLADVVKTVVNFMIYIWEIIIKLLQVLVAHL